MEKPINEIDFDCCRKVLQDNFHWVVVWFKMFAKGSNWKDRCRFRVYLDLDVPLFADPGFPSVSNTADRLTVFENGEMVETMLIPKHDECPAELKREICDFFDGMGQYRSLYSEWANLWF
jgi:hypothetical protein